MSALVFLKSMQKEKQDLGLDINHSQKSNHFTLVAAQDKNFSENESLVTD